MIGPLDTEGNDSKTQGLILTTIEVPFGLRGLNLNTESRSLDGVCEEIRAQINTPFGSCSVAHKSSFGNYSRVAWTQPFNRKLN
jgi:hypothetical protein